MAKKIDRETVQRILDTAQIVDVVSDFVTLKRRGSGYIGLCPFHNERTPSFSVSPTKGICKCFSCGKGGSPVNFIMEMEQLNYGDALRYLAKKYHIDIKEDEMTPEEEQAENDRASLFAVNEMACSYFEHNLTDDPDGRAIGLAYFRHRGISDPMIKKFHLGYALERPDALYMHALRKGFNEKYLIESGLCVKRDNGSVYDRFKGRVIYPVHSVSGKVVAFGGRTLRSDKTVAKYVNSPESQIYKKHLQLYGLYQAKHAIARQDKCILVEGYMDVISMHQSGIENVVASSGTSLTEGQIRLIHRFTENVTVIYDSDAAGIKASLRGIDMLLAEGLNVKVLLLPEGDDPDSFAQHHTATETEQYIRDHETDFITFKIKILLEGTGNDPIARTRVVNDVVASISVIPDAVARDTYVRTCARLLEVEDGVLNAQVAKYMAKRLEREAQERLRAQNRAEAGLEPEGESEGDNGGASEAVQPHTHPVTQPLYSGVSRNRQRLLSYEREMLRLIVKYGMAELCSTLDENGDTITLSLIDTVRLELDTDNISFSCDAYRHAYEEALRMSNASWEADLQKALEAIDIEVRLYEAEQMQRLRDEAAGGDLAALQGKELALREQVAGLRAEKLRKFRSMYLGQRMASSADDTVRDLTTQLITDRYTLSKVHTKYADIPTEEDRLNDVVQRTLAEWRDAILAERIEQIQGKIKQMGSAGASSGQMMSLMQELAELMQMRRQFAKYMGERVVAQK